MATPKRPGNFSHVDRSGKRHQPTFNTAAYDNRAAASRYAKPQQNGSTPPQQPVLSLPELQTGLVALLDTLVAAETTPKADGAMLHHARELRRLLCARTNYPSAKPKCDLDAKRPDNTARFAVPEWVERRLHASKALPPLPPITEPHLHQAVFTHRSATRDPNESLSAQKIDLSLDYERLEYGGDAYLELIATRALCNRFPHVDVPELCSWRERLVENSALSKFSEAYGFPDRLNHRLQPVPGSKMWQKVAADVFEAYVAALVLSDPAHGFQTAEDWLTELWAPQLLGFREKVVENVKARDELNKLVVCGGVTLDYRQDKPMTYDTGSIQHFYVSVYLTGWGYTDEWVGSGEGRTKAQAAIAASNAALKDSNVIRDAAQKKAALMDARRLEKEAEDPNKLAAAAAAAAAETPQAGDKQQEHAPSTPDEPTLKNKRKSDVIGDESSPEPQQKKTKKK